MSLILATTVTGAADALTIQSALVPAERVWYVPFWDIQGNTGAVSNWLKLAILRDNDGLWIQIIDTRDVGAGSSFGDGQPFANKRPVIVPPGWRLRGSTGALPAGSTLSMRFAYLELTIGDETPRF